MYYAIGDRVTVPYAGTRIPGRIIERVRGEDCDDQYFVHYDVAQYGVVGNWHGGESLVVYTPEEDKK